MFITKSPVYNSYKKSQKELIENIYKILIDKKHLFKLAKCKDHKNI